MRNIFIILVLMSGVANAQWYGSVGSSFGEDNVGAFYKIGIETDSDDNFNVASEASLNFMYSNKFLRLAVIPQYSIADQWTVGAGVSTYWSNSYFGTAKWTGGYATKAQYNHDETLSFAVTLDNTIDLGHTGFFGVIFHF